MPSSRGPSPVPGDDPPPPGATSLLRASSGQRRARVRTESGDHGRLRAESPPVLEARGGGSRPSRSSSSGGDSGGHDSASSFERGGAAATTITTPARRKMSGIQKPSFRSPDGVTAAAHPPRGEISGDYGPARSRGGQSRSLFGSGTELDIGGIRSGGAGSRNHSSSSGGLRASGIQRPSFTSPEKPAFKPPAADKQQPPTTLGFKSPDRKGSGIQRPSFRSPDRSPDGTTSGGGGREGNASVVVDATSVLADYRERRKSGTKKPRDEDDDNEVSVRDRARDLASGTTDSGAAAGSSREDDKDGNEASSKSKNRGSPTRGAAAGTANDRQPSRVDENEAASPSPIKSPPQFTAASSPPVSAIRVPSDDDNTTAARSTGGTSALTDDDSAWGHTANATSPPASSSKEGSGPIPTLPEEPATPSRENGSCDDDKDSPIKLAELSSPADGAGALSTLRSLRSEDYLSPASAEDSSEASDLREGIDGDAESEGKGGGPHWLAVGIEPSDSPGGMRSPEPSPTSDAGGSRTDMIVGGSGSGDLGLGASRSFDSAAASAAAMAAVAALGGTTASASPPTGSSAETSSSPPPTASNRLPPSIRTGERRPPTPSTGGTARSHADAATPSTAASRGSAVSRNLSASSAASTPEHRASILRAVAAAENVPGASWANVAEKVPKNEKPSPSTAMVVADDSGAPVNAMKALMPLLSDPTNRSCADCRSPLIDSSKISCSFYLHDPDAVARRTRLAGMGSDGKAGNRMGLQSSDARNPRVIGAKVDFRAQHQAFAPPGGGPGPKGGVGGGKGAGSNRSMGSIASNAPAIDPALLASQRAGGHGVFLCQSCARAHRSLGQSSARVKSLQLGSWTQSEIDVVSASGGNARARAVFERYMPEHWASMIPTNASSPEEREVFVRAKYEALAFMFPSGPLAERAWGHLLQNTGLGSLNDMSMHSDVAGDTLNAGGGAGGGAGTNGVLPNRLVDYFCVVGPSKLARNPRKPSEFPDLSTARRLEDVKFEPAVVDCYPGASAHPDIRLPEHISKFVFPEGCRARSKHLPPTFFAFVLTLESGNRMYGKALHVYDDAVELDGLREMVRDGGYEGALPPWLDIDAESESGAISPRSAESGVGGSNRRASPNNNAPPRMAHLPKCLVLLSHYNFSSLFRTVLRQLYRISLCQAPLPLERYVANFASEVPLPPLGLIEVRYHLTNDLQVSVVRPPPNRLPLAGCPFRPLFACLSTGNIMVVLACLLQETRVALCSRQYGLLGPVSEALLSLMFPLVWQGMYIPVMPYEMLDILDAPVPYIVGLHSRYLKQVSGENRPVGVVFVDIDEDTVHLGFDEEGAMGGGELYGRATPALPDKDANKLRSKLDEHGGPAYLPPSDRRGRCRITYGAGSAMSSSEREGYAQAPFPGDAAYSRTSPIRASRKAVLDKIDRAFVADEYLDAISGFTTEAGTMTERERVKSDKWNVKGMRLNKKSRLRARTSSSDNANNDLLDESTASHAVNDGVVHLLDVDDESDGFSVTEVRNAALRFFVALLRTYEKFLPEKLGGEFRKDDFLKDLNLDTNARSFMDNVLSSQMFERFVEERMSDPDQPEVRFFDESIVAKNNRSKIKAVTKGGRKETPFLSDQSAAISETFTPPPPSNWGLPDDDRVYSYVSFPKLDPELFGKIRPPKQWHQISKKQRRGATSAFLKQQQQILSQALKPGAQQPKGSSRGGGPTMVVGGGGAAPEKDVEWALHALAYRESKMATVKQAAGDENGGAKRHMLVKKGSREVSAAHDKSKAPKAVTVVSVPVDDIPKAHRLIAAARRKQSILLAQIVKAQRMYRMHAARCRYTMLRRAAITLQRQQRKSPTINEVIVTKYERIVLSATLIQRIARGCTARRYMRAHLDAAIRIQTFARRVAAQDNFNTLWYATVMGQTIWRGRKVRFLYGTTRSLVARTQGLARGWITRRHVITFRRARANRYRTQLYVLWRHARTSLAYRSRFWLLVDGSCFLHLALLEDELERLWEILNVDFRALVASKVADDLVDEYTAGAAGSVYKKYQLVQARLDSAAEDEKKKRSKTKKTEGLKKQSDGSQRHRQEKELVATFPAEFGANEQHGNKARVQALRQATAQLSEEKMQIYEKLDTLTDKKALAGVYATFGIQMAEKQKKQRFIEAIWETYYPDQSMKAYFALFPETSESDGVSFLGTPSKKAQKRFASSHGRAKTSKRRSEDHKNVWVQAKIDAIIKTNLKEVTAGLLSGMNAEMLRRERIRQKGPTMFERQQNAFQGWRPDLKWKVVRFFIIRNFVHPGTAPALPPRRYSSGNNKKHRSSPPKKPSGGGARKFARSPR